MTAAETAVMHLQVKECQVWRATNRRLEVLRVPVCLTFNSEYVETLLYISHWRFLKNGGGAFMYLNIIIVSVTTIRQTWRSNAKLRMGKLLVCLQ